MLISWSSLLSTRVAVCIHSIAQKKTTTVVTARAAFAKQISPSLWVVRWVDCSFGSTIQNHERVCSVHLTHSLLAVAAALEATSRPTNTRAMYFGDLWGWLGCGGNFVAFLFHIVLKSVCRSYVIQRNMSMKTASYHSFWVGSQLTGAIELTYIFWYQCCTASTSRDLVCAAFLKWCYIRNFDETRRKASFPSNTYNLSKARRTFWVYPVRQKVTSNGH